MFLPVTFAGYYILNRFSFRSMAKIWLVLCSFYFYSQGSPSFFPFFLGSVVANYLVGITLIHLEGNQKSQRKWLLAAGIGGNVALLGYYKYTDFFIVNVNRIAHTDYALKHIVLPIGISFFTFQLIAFLVDCYRGETKQYDFINYLLFITFFPQLIVGPIIHHAQVVPQFENKENAKINFDHIALGLFLFSVGCAKKILLADPMTTAAQDFFNSLPKEPGLLQTWFAACQYTVSYYFDLSGYADMAIGLGWLFNISIPQNFNSPYKARNFQEYWRRWHMTLSSFLSAYIFKSVYKRDSKYRNYYIATMVTFLVSGFWHGAGWTFVLWGLINGALVCIASWMKRKNYSFPAWLAYPLTALGVVVCRVLFISDSFSMAKKVYAGMLNFGSLGHSAGEIIATVGKFVMWHKSSGLLFVVGLFICWFMPNSKSMEENFKPTVRNLIMAAGLLLICFINMNRVVQFLYFQF